MTREEFSDDLFEAVKTVGSILAIQQQYTSAVQRQDQATMGKLLSERDQLRTKLNDVVPKLSDVDAAELFRQYPFVVR